MTCLFHKIDCIHFLFTGAFCGNKIVEAGEECDCGYDDNECVDKCCYPRQVSELDKIKNETAKGCNRKYGTQCRCARELFPIEIDIRVGAFFYLYLSWL